MAGKKARPPSLENCILLLSCTAYKSGSFHQNLYVLKACADGLGQPKQNKIVADWLAETAT